VSTQNTIRRTEENNNENEEETRKQIYEVIDKVQ
jgi:hypothetical protein